MKNGNRGNRAAQGSTVAHAPESSEEITSGEGASDSGGGDMYDAPPVLSKGEQAKALFDRWTAEKSKIHDAERAVIEIESAIATLAGRGTAVTMPDGDKRKTKFPKGDGAPSLVHLPASTAAFAAE